MTRTTDDASADFDERRRERIPVLANACSRSAPPASRTWRSASKPVCPEGRHLNLLAYHRGQHAGRARRRLRRLCHSGLRRPIRSHVRLSEGRQVLRAIVVGLLSGAATILVCQRLIASAQFARATFPCHNALRSAGSLRWLPRSASLGVHGSPSAVALELRSTTGALLIGFVAWTRVSAIARIYSNGASPEHSYNADVRVRRNG